MSLRTKSTTAFKPPLPLPLLAFASLFVISWALCRTSSSSLYHPLTSTRYDPPPQPSQGRSIRNSIVVPAYHERANLRPLAERVFRALDEPRESELIIVDDDSRDGTEQEVARLREEGYNVELLVRKGENGLSSAVLRGFEVARGSRLVVMDADLQHPPEVIQPLLDSLSTSNPIALGTRYGKGVSMSAGWPLYRRIISWGARVLARPLTSASDPMTGFFAITKDQFLLSAPINTSGFKIALELLLKSPSSAIAETPYSFGLRQTGSSKLSSKVMLRYVGQLLTLYAWRWGFWFYFLVGSGGALAAVLLELVFREWKRRRDPGMLLPGGGGKGKLFNRTGPPQESKRFV